MIDAMCVTLVDSTPDNIAVSAYLATARAMCVDVDLDAFVHCGHITFARRIRELSQSPTVLG